jgi:hypothetical protein
MKATVVKPDGTKVDLEGIPADVSEVLLSLLAPPLTVDLLRPRDLWKMPIGESVTSTPNPGYGDFWKMPLDGSLTSTPNPGYGDFRIIGLPFTPEGDTTTCTRVVPVGSGF